MVKPKPVDVNYEKVTVELPAGIDAAKWRAVRAMIATLDNVRAYFYRLQVSILLERATEADRTELHSLLRWWVQFGAALREQLGRGRSPDD